MPVSSDTSNTSASPADLKEFLTRGERKRTALLELLNAAALSSKAVHGASADYHPTVSALSDGGNLLGTVHANDRFVGVVRDAVVAADRQTGSPTVSDSVISTALSRHGLLTRPKTIAVTQMALYGLPPTSGFVDDPICAANGNFVHTDLDLALPGFAACLNVERTYNSLAHRLPGVFGWGWCCLLDMRVSAPDPEGPVVVVFLADGAALTFQPDEEAGYLPDHRRKLTLERHGDGWRLTHDITTSWRSTPPARSPASSADPPPPTSTATASRSG